MNGPQRSRKCIVPSCPFIIDVHTDKKFFRLPKNDRKIWLDAVGRTDCDSFSSSIDFYICEDHYLNNPLLKVTSIQGGSNIALSNAHLVSLKRNNTSIEDAGVSNAKIPAKHVTLQRVPAGTTIATIGGNLVNIQQKSGQQQQQQQQQQIIRSNSGIKLDTGTSIKIAGNNKQYSIPFISSNGAITTGNTSGGTAVGTTITSAQGTPITVSGGGSGVSVGGTTFATTTGQMRRPTIFIKGPPKRTIRSVTIELIEKSPKLHIGLSADRVNILKSILCNRLGVPLMDLYLTLKKLRLNEDFPILGEYFELSEDEVQRIFAQTIMKLAPYMKYLIRWPESKKYYDRHKNLPIAYRSKLSFVQSLIECVETEIRKPFCPTIDMINCKNFKFILTITPTGVVSYVSEAYMGNNDDLTIFNASNFRDIIPKYLSLVADPGEGIPKQKSSIGGRNLLDTDSTTDSADEDENKLKRAAAREEEEANAALKVNDNNNTSNKNKNSNNKTNNNNNSKNNNNNRNNSNNNPINTKPHNREQLDASSRSSLNIVNSQLTSLKVKDFSIPTLHVQEPMCRFQIRNMIDCLREYKILQPYSVLEPQIYQYINEILIVVSALINLQR